MPTILSDFLNELQVPHTAGASDRAFHSMPFRSLFGFSRLLASYGIDSRALDLTDRTKLADVPAPFLARMKDAFVIVTDISPDGRVIYLAFGEKRSQPIDSFNRDFTGTILQAFPTPDSSEPDYRRNRLMEGAAEAKKVVLWLCGALLLLCGFISGRLWHNPGAVALVAVDIAGIMVTWLLTLKSLAIKNNRADRICAVLQEHGCDHVLENKASTFFGIFSWSEVGITYFSVSTLILLLFPQSMPLLAVLNACCLPFTFWSIWYQRFRIHTWCTLCVITQGLLWLQFGAYLWSGAWQGVGGICLLNFIPAVAAYGFTLMAVNRLMNYIKSRS